MVFIMDSGREETLTTKIVGLKEDLTFELSSFESLVQTRF